MKHQFTPIYLGLSLAASTASATYKPIIQPINKVIDVSIKDDRNLNLLTYVTYPNGCFQPMDADGFVDEQAHKINLVHTARQFEGICTQDVVPNFPAVSVAPVDDRAYEVFDYGNQRRLGELRVHGKEVTFVTSENLSPKTRIDLQ